uniref:Reverse transcriptase domain-containing protein n=1 Tax=Tanacetum cinerariifolium TaxID=118510 RepID=A0A699KS45_TANCI|nr:reverse transcriptase domain-containing protein [Tanacetum cinerariifolium]
MSFIVVEITFPSLATSSGTEGPLVIEAEIGEHMIHRMYVDRGSSTETWNKKIQAVPSTTHRMLKFQADRGIVTIRSTILIPTECATVITSSKKTPKEAGVRHESFKVALHSNFPDQEVAIGGTLSAKGRTELCSLLKENLDIFAWQSSDMIRVPRSVAEHRLNIREGYSPVRHKKRVRPRNARRPSKQRLSPDTVGIVRRGENDFPHRPRGVLLYKNAFWPQERWHHVPTAGGQSLR